MYERRSPRPPSYSPTPVYPSKFHRRPSTPSQFSQADLFPAYRRPSRHHYPVPAYSLPRPSVERQGWLSSRAHVPALQPASRKTDLTKQHSEPGAFRTMFRQFQYPAKVPAIPDRIHRGQQPRGRINVTVNEAEMHPSYVSHQTSRLLTPESLSEDSEEELLLRAEEGSSDGVSEPPSLTESEEDQMSREEQFEQAPPYQAMEEEHYRSFRSTPSARPPSVLSSKSVEVQVETVKPKKKKKKKPKVSPPSSLSPLQEEEEKPKPPHKAKVPPAFPAHQSPQFIPQPIIYQMPQPFPMPFPIYPPNPQYYYQPYYPPPPAYRPPSPEPPAPVVHKRERSTQYATTAKVDKKPVDPPIPQAPLFESVLADIDRRLGTPVPDSIDVKYRKAVALEIGIGETTSLAERFQQKLPSVSAKLNSRDSERPRREHKDKSTTELLEIRKEMLKHGNSPRASIVEEAPWRGDAAQIEKADRLAAGSSSVTKRQGLDGEERGRKSGLGRPVVVVTTDSGRTVTREEAVRQTATLTVPKPVVKASAIEKPEKPESSAGTKTDIAGTAGQLAKAAPLGKSQGSAPAKVENPPSKLGPELPSSVKTSLKPGPAKPGPESTSTVISGSIQLGVPSTAAKPGTSPKSGLESLPITKPGPTQLGVPGAVPSSVKAGAAERQESVSLLVSKQGTSLKVGPDTSKLVPAKVGADTPAKAGDRSQTISNALTPKTVLEALSPKAGVSSAARVETSQTVLAKPTLTISGSSIPAITRSEERIQAIPLTPRAVLEALSPKAGAFSVAGKQGTVGKPGPAEILSKPGLRIPTSETPSSAREKTAGFEALAAKVSGVAEPRPGTDTPSSVVSSRSVATAGLGKVGSDTPKSAAMLLRAGAVPKSGLKSEPVTEESKKPAGQPVKMQ